MPFEHNSYSFEEKKCLKSEIANRGWKMKKVDENFRFFFRLHQVSSHPQSILGLCALFENIIQKVISFSGQNSKDVFSPFEWIWLWSIILSTNQISGSTFSLATFNPPGLCSGIFSGCLYILFFLVYFFWSLFLYLFLLFVFFCLYMLVFICLVVFYLGVLSTCWQQYSMKWITKCQKCMIHQKVDYERLLWTLSTLPAPLSLGSGARLRLNGGDFLSAFLSTFFSPAVSFARCCHSEFSQGEPSEGEWKNSKTFLDAQFFNMWQHQ